MRVSVGCRMSSTGITLLRSHCYFYGSHNRSYGNGKEEESNGNEKVSHCQGTLTRLSILRVESMKTNIPLFSFVTTIREKRNDP